MGRPLFSVSFTNSVGSGDDIRLGAVAEEGRTAEEAGPRRWCEKDADPDEDAWWTGKDIVIESFVDQPIEPRIVAASCAHLVESALPTTAQPASTAVANQENNNDSGKLMGLQPPTQIQNHLPIDTIDTAALFPGRFTISEEELARVTLDSIITDEGNNNEDDDDDFELVWDREQDKYEEDMDNTMDVDETDASHSDASTPAPSTPVMEPTHVNSLLTTASSMHDFATHCMLPAPATSLRQASLPIHTPSMSSPSTARSAARLRGFAVHSPRTELVL